MTTKRYNESLGFFKKSQPVLVDYLNYSIGSAKEKIISTIKKLFSLSEFKDYRWNKYRDRKFIKANSRDELIIELRKIEEDGGSFGDCRGKLTLEQQADRIIDSRESFLKEHPEYDK